MLCQCAGADSADKQNDKQWLCGTELSVFLETHFRIRFAWKVRYEFGGGWRTDSYSILHYLGTRKCITGDDASMLRYFAAGSSGRRGGGRGRPARGPSREPRPLSVWDAQTPMNAVFVDTSFYAAIINRRDQWHARAREAGAKTIGPMLGIILPLLPPPPLSSAGRERSRNRTAVAGSSPLQALRTGSQPKPIDLHRHPSPAKAAAGSPPKKGAYSDERQLPPAKSVFTLPGDYSSIRYTADFVRTISELPATAGLARQPASSLFVATAANFSPGFTTNVDPSSLQK